MAVSLTLRRNRYLIPICIITLLILVYYGNKRVISVNIWDKGEVTTDYYNVENTIDLFVTTQVHDVKILMTDEEYKDMIDTYASTSEKDWYKTDVTIDGVTVYNVGIRLKWNSSLKGVWWYNEWGPWRSVSWMDRWVGKHRDGSWDNRMMGFHANRFWNRPAMSWDFQKPEVFEGWSFWPWAMSWGSIDYDTQLPLFIKFDKYEDQTYQWHEMISLRVGGMGNDVSLLSEPYSYELYQEEWDPAPDTSYWAVQIDWMEKRLFIISELPEDEYYIKKWFGDDNGVLYKAGNFIDFSYQWDDPTEYSDYFTQKTRINDYDISPLIKLLKFVSTSTDEEFAESINDYIDVDSVLTVLAIDDFVGNQDSFGGMWSNYYLYYHLWEGKFYLLTRDQNLAFWGMWGWWGMWWGMWWAFPWMPNFWGEFSWENMQWMISQGMPTATSWWMQWPQNFWWFPEDFSWWTMWAFPWEWFNPENIEWWFPGFPWGDNEWGENRGWWMWRNGNNELKTRLLANETFKARYDEIYAEIENIALNSDFSESFFETRSNAILKYNEDTALVDEESYLKAVESLKSYLENKKTEE